MNELWAITGATGYVGSALRTDLYAAGISTRSLGRSEAEDIRRDVRDPVALSDLVRGASVVVHLAASVHRRSAGRRAAEECWSVNVDGTQNVVDAIRGEASRPFLIFVSSASVYGSSSAPANESTRCAPRTSYGLSKLEAELRVLEAIKSGSIRGCVLRPAMIFGPGAPGNLRLLARMVDLGIAIEVAHGAQRKSVVPLSHAIEAIRAVAAHPDECNGEVFNVAGETLTMHEIIMALASRRTKAPFFIQVPRWLATTAIRAIAVFAPRLSTIAETYTRDAQFDGGKLARMLRFAPPERAAKALAEIDGKKKNEASISARLVV
jgi:nucleoside-diphosphate-sugar epimerase